MKRTAVIVILGLAGGAGLAGRQAPVFRGGVDVVQVDVSVLDKDRQPVRNLTAADFTVFEDGRPQPIVGFDAVDVADAVPPPAAWMTQVSPDVATNDLDDRRLIVMVIDDALIPFDPVATQTSKRIARDVINRLGLNDLAAIVFTADNRRTQDFTGDHRKLLAAVDRFVPGMASYAFGTDAGGRVNTDSHYYLSAVGVLRNVTEYLIDVPQRRKALIYISPGVPFDAGQLAPILSSTTGAGLADQGVMARLLDEMNEVFRLAQRANVNVYAIDPMGTNGLESFVLSRLAGKLPPDVAIEKAHQVARITIDFLEAAAANTGGRTIVHTDDFAPGIAQIFRENGSYYLIGFRPANTKADGTLRRVEVKVNRPGVEVRSRSGYYAAEAPKARKNAPPSPLAKAMSGLLPNPDLPLQVTLAPFAVPGERDPTVAIVLGVRQPVPLDAASTRVTENVELQTSAFTPDGNPRGSKRQSAKIVLRMGSSGEARYELLSRIDLKPGRYQLRLAAHNAAREKSGSVYAEVEIPDFAGAALSLSGAILAATPGRAAAPKDALAAILTLVPTAEREFTVVERVTALVRVYQSGRTAVAPVALSIRIVDGHDATKFTSRQTLGADRFELVTRPTPQTSAVALGGRGGLARQPPASVDSAASRLRAYDVTLDIPFDRLGRGPHVLTFEARIGEGTTIRRDVRFAVR